MDPNCEIGWLPFRKLGGSHQGNWVAPVGGNFAIGTFSGIPGLLGSIGDLAPFLLPSRWIQARESSKLYRAQQYAVAIMQLDSMQIVEGLSMVVGRDNYLHDQLKMDRALHTQLIQEVQTVEDLGKIAPGSSLAIAATANMLDQTISSLESQLKLEMTDLSQAAGFINPSAISSLVVLPLGDIQQPPQLDLKVLQSTTLSRAPELGQMKALMEAAKLQRESRFFQWLDPQGDSSGGLGFGLPTYVEIGQSNLRQLFIARDQLNSSLLRKITDAYNDYLGWIDSYRLAVEGVNFQTKRISFARQALQSSFAGSAVEELREAAEQLYVNHANLITAQYAWYVSLSRVNRLSRQGPYDRISAVVPVELK